jgi:putative redox protein
MSLITVKHQKDFRVTATVGNHKLTFDAPAEQGGTNAGPTPVELLVASVGTCMAIHIAKYCKAARLPYEGFGMHLDFELARDPLRIGSITVDIELPDDFPRDRVVAVKRAAEQCTVKNTLKESTSVDVEILAGVA